MRRGSGRSGDCLRNPRRHHYPSDGNRRVKSSRPDHLSRSATWAAMGGTHAAGTFRGPSCGVQSVVARLAESTARPGLSRGGRPSPARPGQATSVRRIRKWPRVSR
jgi:hypothetical protein